MEIGVIVLIVAEVYDEINRPHKWALKALNGDYESKFEELQDMDKSKTKDLQIFLVET